MTVFWETMFPVVSRWIFGGSGQYRIYKERDWVEQDSLRTKRFRLLVTKCTLRKPTLSGHIVDLNFCFEREKDLTKSFTWFESIGKFKISVFLTQEVQFSRKWESVSIRHKCVVAGILWLHVINNQPVKPVNSVWQQDQKENICLTNTGKNLSHELLTKIQWFFCLYPAYVILTFQCESF